MKVLLIIGGLLAVLVVAIVVLLGSAGYFTDIKVTEKEMDGFQYVYKDFKGPYHKTKPVFDEVYETLKEKGIDSEKGIGVYYDDPKNTKPENLRSRCGSVVSEEDIEKLANTDTSLKTAAFKQGTYMTAVFPVKNGLSYMIGPMKVYKEMGDYAKKHDIAIDKEGYEIYDMKGKKIYYLFKL